MLEEADERELLRAKVKQLEQQITERAHNYMMTGRPRVKPRPSTSDASAQTHNTQNLPHEKQATKELSREMGTDPTLESLQFVVEDVGGVLPVNLDEQQEGVQGIVEKMSVVECRDEREQVLRENQNIFQNILQKLRAILNVSSANTNNQQPNVKQNEDFLQQINKKHDQNTQKLLLMLNQIPTWQQQNQQNLNYKQQLQQAINQQKVLQTRCDIIKQALNESQQMNYQLRVQIQQCEQQLRNAQQTIQNNKIETYEQAIEQLRLKVTQMEVMKKQYLRAYSRVKEEKEELELRLLEMEEKEAQARDHSHARVGPKEELVSLQTIIEYSDEESIEDFNRRTANQDTLEVIKQIINKALSQDSRQKLEKWIREALLKIQQYSNEQNQQKSKLAESHHLIQESLHKSYKNVLTSVQRATIKQKNLLQEQFNACMNKMIEHCQQILEKHHKHDATISNIRSQHLIIHNQPIVGSLSDLQSPLIPRQGKVQKTTADAKKVDDLMQNLAKMQRKYLDMKSNYEKLQQTVITQSKSKLYADFHEFMNKIVTLNAASNKQSRQQHIEAEHFHRIALKVYEIINNLPAGEHIQLYFIPSSHQELEDALQIIYKFTQQYDRKQQTQLKQFKKQSESLTKVIGEIATHYQADVTVLLRSIEQHLQLDNSVSSQYIKKLVKRLQMDEGLKKPQSLQIEGQSQIIKLKTSQSC